ncbi:MAG: hypothetical protein QXI58_01425 [Candidatus Micrarchaeia archaeon]
MPETRVDLESQVKGFLPYSDMYFWRKEGRYYPAGHSNALALTTATPSANVLLAFPLIIPVSTTFDQIAINVTTAKTGQARLGIYRDNNNQVYPGSLILDAGVIDTGTTGVKILSIDLTLTPGLYWAAYVTNAGPTVRAIAVGGSLPILGFDSTLGTASGVGYSISYTFNPLPQNFPSEAGVYSGAVVGIFLRVKKINQ